MFKRKQRRETDAAYPTQEDGVAEAEARLDAARAEAQRLQHAWPPRAELLGRIEPFIDRCASDWLTSTSASVLNALTDHPNPCAPQFGPNSRVNWGLLCATDRAGAIRMLTVLLERADYEEGPSAADRARVVEEAWHAVREATAAVREAYEARDREIGEITGMPRTRVVVEPRSVGEHRPLTAPNIMRRPSDRVIVRTSHGCLVADD